MSNRESNKQNIKHEFNRHILAQVLQQDAAEYKRMRPMIKAKPAIGDKDLFHMMTKQGA
jgi:hypothetical protein